LSQAASYIGDIFSGKKIMIVSDDNVYPLYGKGLTDALSQEYECHHLILPHGETTRFSGTSYRILSLAGC